MTKPEENLDDILRKGLQSRFDECEADVKPHLYKNIYDRLHTATKTTVWYLVGIFLMIGWAVSQSMEKQVMPGATANVKTQTSHSIVTEMSKRGETNEKVFIRKTAKIRTKSGGETLPAQPQYQTPRPVPDKARTGAKTGARDILPGSGLKPGQQKTAPTENREDAATQGATASYGSMPDVGMLKPIAVKTGLASLQLPAVQIPQPEKSDALTPSEDGLSWIFSANGSQTFQTVDTRSSSGLLYQNIRFAPFWSARSKALTATAGIESHGFQLLATYNHRRDWIYYELGTDEFDIRPDGNSGYQFSRRGTPLTYDKVTHTLGLGLNKVMHFKEGFLRRYEAVTGLVYQTTLSGNRQRYLSVGASIGRPFKIAPQLSVSAGPFVEYGMIKQRVEGINWHYRPYQLGVSLTGKLHQYKTHK